MKMARFFTPFIIGAVIGFGGCGGEEDNPYEDRDLKQDMQDFVIGIGNYARSLDSDFILLPQNGGELITSNGSQDGEPDLAYLSSIQGVGREDLFYGYEQDNHPTPGYETEYMCDFLDIAEANGVQVLTTDYCSFHSYMDDSYIQNAVRGYISFAAPSRELEVIPDYPAPPFNVNADDITTLSEAKNFLYLLNPQNFASKTDFLTALQNTNYDILIIDLFYQDEVLSASEVASLKIKANGGSRLVIAYMSIGEAEDYRYYWQPDWEVGAPEWIVAENPYWEGNYIVEYWNAEWQAIIFGNENSYTAKIINVEFDGAYLDIVDAFEYFE